MALDNYFMKISAMDSSQKNCSFADILPVLDDDTLFSNLDRHFGAFISRLAAQSSPELFLAAALLSSRTNNGHVCLDLRSMAGKPLAAADKATPLSVSFVCPSLDNWLSKIRQSCVAGQPVETTPLVLDRHGRLYLRRYWEYENSIAHFIIERSRPAEKKINYQGLSKGLAAHFPAPLPRQTDWQKIAAFAALTRSFCIISGGPGTGKTFTAAKILTLLDNQKENAEGLRILLGAPTGKAAARLQDSLAGISPVHSKLLPRAATVHRLLGARPNSPYFQHNSENPLQADVIIVDESSMVDLPLMAKLMQAVPPGAKLILLGDHHQLASVQPGSVLGDICHADHLDCFTEEFLKQLVDNTGEQLQVSQLCNPAIRYQFLQDSIVELKQGFRFSSDSGIEILSRAVKNSDTEMVHKTLFEKGNSQVAWLEIPSPDGLPGILKNWQGFTEIATMQHANGPADCLAALNRNRILCGLRSGPYGAHNINRIMAGLLEKSSDGQGQAFHLHNDLSHGNTNRAQTLHAGQPVMITQNDYNLQLFNGDVGIVLPDPESGNRLRVYFAGESGGGIRKIAPAMLPAHETVYAMTVHKSQGSEFDNVLLILPDRDAPVLTRELLYTGVSRAKKRVEIWGRREVFQNSVDKQIIRQSGLNEMLWT